MSQVIKKLKDYLNMDWNSLTGRSTEIVRNEDSPSQYVFDWRVAIDDVPSAGVLPPFNGYMRYFSVLEGSNVNLVINNQFENTMSTFQQVKVEGSSAMAVTPLSGPVKDLNLIYNNELYTGHLQWCRLGEVQNYTSSADVIIIFAAAPQVLATVDQAPASLANYDTLIVTHGGSKDITLASPTGSPTDHACVMELLKH